MPEWRICALRQHTLPLGTKMPCKSAGLKRSRRRTAREVPCKASKLTTYWWAKLGSYITYDRKNMQHASVRSGPKAGTARTDDLTKEEWPKSGPSSIKSKIKNVRTICYLQFRCLTSLATNTSLTPSDEMCLSAQAFRRESLESNFLLEYVVFLMEYGKTKTVLHGWAVNGGCF